MCTQTEDINFCAAKNVNLNRELMMFSGFDGMEKYTHCNTYLILESKVQKICFSETLSIAQSRISSVCLGKNHVSGEVVHMFYFSTHSYNFSASAATRQLSSILAFSFKGVDLCKQFRVPLSEQSALFSQKISSSFGHYILHRNHLSII